MYAMCGVIDGRARVEGDLKILATIVEGINTGKVDRRRRHVYFWLQRETRDLLYCQTRLNIPLRSSKAWLLTVHVCDPASYTSVLILPSPSLHLPLHTPSPTALNPANPPPNPPALPSPVGLFSTFPCPLTPSTTLSSPVSTTTPPTIISPSTACSVSKLKIRSNSQTFSNRRSSASTNTWIRSRRASGDSVEVDIRMK